ncbi:MAG TPA: hypothetical protein PKC49_01550 [Phycisphaerae bacterium]|nr:hypothetical protein [Phycisphaerae bacterium]
MSASTARVSVLWAMLAASGAVVAAAQRADPAEWAPADALFFVGLDDVRDLQARFEKTSTYALLSNPAMKDLSDDIRTGLSFFEEFKGRLAKFLDVPADRLKNPFGGGLAVFAQSTGDKEDPFRFALVVGVDDTALMKEYYEKIITHLKANADQHETVEFASQQIATFKRSRSGETPDELDELFGGRGGEDAIMRAIEKALDYLFSADALPAGLALCLTPDRLIIAGGAEQVQDVLREQRRAGPLRESADYRALTRQFEPLGSVRFMVNVPRLIEMAQVDMDDSGRKSFATLGLRTLGSLIGHVTVNGEDFNYKLEATLQLGEQRSGLVRLLTMPNRDVAPPADVPADAIFFTAINVDPPALIDEIERMLRQYDPAMADEFKSNLSSLSTPDGNLDLRQQLFGNLRGPLAMCLQATRPYSPESFRLMLTVGHRDRAAVERLLGQLAGLNPGMLSTRDLAGKQMLDVQLLGLSVGAGAETLYAGSTALVESRIQSATGDALASDPGFRRAARSAPREAWGVFYMDGRRLMEVAIELARHQAALRGAMFNPAAMMGAGLIQSSVGNLNVDKLDQARSLLKHYGQSIITAATSSDGIRYTQVDLKPAAD